MIIFMVEDGRGREPGGITTLPPMDRREAVNLMTRALRTGVSAVSTKVADPNPDPAARDPFGHSQVTLIDTRQERAPLVRRATSPHPPSISPKVR
jgi:hypothetical protein